MCAKGCFGLQAGHAAASTYAASAGVGAYGIHPLGGCPLSVRAAPSPPFSLKCPQQSGDVFDPHPATRGRLVGTAQREVCSLLQALLVARMSALSQHCQCCDGCCRGPSGAGKGWSCALSVVGCCTCLRLCGCVGSGWRQQVGFVGCAFRTSGQHLAFARDGVQSWVWWHVLLCW